MNRKRVAPKPGEALRPATRTAAPARQGPGLYGDLVGGIADVLEAARRASARAVNAIMTATYWEIGRRIVEHEQQGKARAEYGEDLLKRLATDLSARFGRGFGWRNLFQMRAFYLMYPPEKLQTASAMSPRADSPPAPAPKERIRQTRSGELPASGEDPTVLDVSRMTWLAARFPLPWSAYVRLLAVKHEDARAFYEAEDQTDAGTERAHGGWEAMTTPRKSAQGRDAGERARRAAPRPPRRPVPVNGSRERSPNGRGEERG